jgi:dTDP-D-glucose 4,6-dehydratase
MQSFPWTEKFVPMSTYQASIEELTLPMDHLVTFSVKDFLGLDDEVSFIGKLLSWAPVLEKVKIEGASETEEIMVLKKLLTLPRLSQNAKIIFA